MRLFQVFLDIFCIIIFLTLGSLMLIVSFHILPLEDALIKVQSVYESSGEGFKLTIAGVLLIIAGLILTKSLVKKSQSDDDFFVVDGDGGRLTITYGAVNQLAQKVLRRFDAVRQPSVSTRFEHDELRITASINILPGWNLSELTKAIETELELKVRKLLRSDFPVVVRVNVVKIEDVVNDLSHSVN